MARVKASTYLLRCRPDTLRRARIIARASGVSLRVWIESAMLESLREAPDIPEDLLDIRQMTLPIETADTKLDVPKVSQADAITLEDLRKAEDVLTRQTVVSPGMPERVPASEPPRPVRPKARV